MKLRWSLCRNRWSVSTEYPSCNDTRKDGNSKINDIYIVNFAPSIF